MALTDQQIFEVVLRYNPSEREKMKPIFAQCLLKYEDYISNYFHKDHNFVENLANSHLNRGICKVIIYHTSAKFKSKALSVIDDICEIEDVCYLFPCPIKFEYSKKPKSEIVEMCLTPRINLLKTIIKIIEENPNN